ncbi:hypothetical protein M9X92_012128 [Pyricularia oryzae]|nr:hypothetical protein M9X92_012128 [Pyricularia oryzae]
MAAFEAKNSGKTKMLIPLWIHGTIPVAYFFLTLGSILTVDWQDPHLPSSYGSDTDNGPAQVKKRHGDCNGHTPNSVVILGIFKGVTTFGQNEAWACFGRGAINAAGVLNGILIFTTMSAASAALYVSSRTLYGLTYKEKVGGRFGKFLQESTGTVWKETGAPAKAVVASVFALYVIIGLSYVARQGSKSTADFLHIFGTTLGVSVLIVWAVLCFAYLRYWYWTYRHKGRLSDEYLKFVPSGSGHYEAKGLTFGQPYMAFVGFISCTTVLFLVSNTMWKNGADPVRFFAAFLSHIIFALIVIGRKLFYTAYPKRDGNDNVVSAWASVESASQIEDKIQELIDLARRLEDEFPEGQQNGESIQLQILGSSQEQSDERHESQGRRV